MLDLTRLVPHCFPQPRAALSMTDRLDGEGMEGTS